jgi:hypothetical protein
MNICTLAQGAGSVVTASAKFVLFQQSVAAPEAERKAIAAGDCTPIAVVCTLVPNMLNMNLTDPTNELQSRIDAARMRPDIVPEECFILHRPLYRNHAGQLIAYAATSNDQPHQQLREEVDRLGEWIAPRLGAQLRGWSYRET